MASAWSRLARPRGLFPLMVLAVLVSTGCGGSGASVSGVVTLDGKPLERGTVAFTPAAGGKRATGVIASDGGYELSTNRDEGLAAGEYSAMVVSRQPGAPSQGPPMPGPSLIPERYGAEDTSGLKYTVESGGNTINIELSSEGGAPPAGAAR